MSTRFLLVRDLHRGIVREEGFHPAEGEGRTGEGLYRHGEEQGGVVVGRNAVGVQHTAGAAAVDNGPFSVFSHPYTDGVHNPMAKARPVPRLFIHMKAAQAPRAVVAVLGSRVLRLNHGAAHLAGEDLPAGETR